MVLEVAKYNRTIKEARLGAQYDTRGFSFKSPSKKLHGKISTAGSELSTLGNGACLDLHLQ